MGKCPIGGNASCFVAKDAPYVPHHGSHMGRWEVSHQRSMAAGRQFTAGESSARRTPSAIAEERIIAVGLASPLPMISGAVP